MNKKLIAIVLVLVMLSSVIFSACSVLQVNEERDNNQAVATITYKGLSSSVTKLELMEYFYTSGYYTYVTQYGMELETVMESLLQGLSQSRLAVLVAREYFCTKNNLPVTTPVTELMRNDELSYCIEQVNETFKESYDTLYAEIEEEKALLNAAQNDDEDDEDEIDTSDWTDETLAARTTRTAEEEEYPVFTGEDIAKANVTARFFDSLDISKDAIAAEAKKRLEKNMASNYRDFDYYLERQCESLLINNYKLQAIEAGITVTDADVLAEYSNIIKKNIMNYSLINRKAYETAMGNGFNTAIYQPFYGYGGVLQILFKFNEDELDLIEQYSDYATNDQAVVDYTIALAKNMTVDISNPAYVAEDAVCSDPDYDAEVGDKNLTKNPAVFDDPADIPSDLAVINQHNCSDPNCPCKAYLELDVPVMDVLERISADVNAATTPSAKLQAFEAWIYKVNDDPGMFNTDTYGYVVDTEGAEDTSLSYAKAFDALTKALVIKGEIANWYLTDAEIAAITVEGKEYVTGVTLPSGNMSFCVAPEYGIHLCMLSALSYPNAAAASVDAEGNPVFGLDYVIDNFNNKTLRQVIADSLLEQMKTDNYSFINTKLYKENKENIVTNEKIYQEVLDAYSE